MNGNDPIHIGIRLPPAPGGGHVRRLACDRRILSADPRVITWWREVPLLRLIARIFAYRARLDWRGFIAKGRSWRGAKRSRLTVSIRP